MTGMTKEKQEANKRIAGHVERAYKEIEAAELLAKKYGLEFDFSLAYGMGGTFIGKPEERYVRSEIVHEGWHPSSQQGC